MGGGASDPGAACFEGAGRYRFPGELASGGRTPPRSRPREAGDSASAGPARIASQKRMRDLEEAVGEIASFLDEMKAPNMIVGAMAVSLWGEPRATLDIDVSLFVEPAEMDQFIATVVARFRAAENARDFVRRTRVLPVETHNGVRADLVFAALPVEREMIARAVWKNVGERSVRVASVEDLV